MNLGTVRLGNPTPRRDLGAEVTRRGSAVRPQRLCTSSVPRRVAEWQAQPGTPLNWSKIPAVPYFGRHSGPSGGGRGEQQQQRTGASPRDTPPVGQTQEEEPPVEDDKGILHNVTKALRDFGFGRTSLLEGGVGLFLLAGLGLLFMLYSWIRGAVLGSGRTGYQAVMEFPQACGIIVGTPVRIRGVPVGTVMNVRPSLERVDVLIEVRDSSTVIPRNSVIEANQSGLIAEPLVDVTPQLPIPEYKAGPLDEECEEEGKILCSQGRIQGQPGVSVDDMVYIATKLARQMDAQGTDCMFDAARKATVLMEEARPLLDKAVQLAEEVVPILKEVRQGQLVGNMETLTSTASEAANDIHRLQNEVLTQDNVDALRQSVLTLTKTLEHIESISGNIGTVTSDGGVQKNIRQIIEALSRMIAD